METNVAGIVQSATGKAQKSDGISVRAFLSSMLVSLICFFLGSVIFVLLKDRLVHIYQPRSRDRKFDNVPPLAPGPFRWLEAVSTVSEKILLQECGLDAYLFIRYLRVAACFFAFLTILAVPMLVPLNVLQERRSGPSGMNRLSWSGVGSQAYLWAHAVAVVIIAVSFSLGAAVEYRNLLNLRQEYWRSPSRRGQHLVAIRDIKDEFRQEDYDHCSKLVNVWRPGDRRRLDAKAARRREIIAKLEMAETHLIRQAIRVVAKKGLEHISWSERGNPRALYALLGGPVDAKHLSRIRRRGRVISAGQQLSQVAQYCEGLRELDLEIAPLQRCFARPKSAALLQFEDRPAAFLASHTLTTGVATAELLDSTKDNVQIENLSAGWRERMLRLYGTRLVSVLLVLLWTFPMACTGTLSQVAALEDDVAWLRWLQRVPAWILGLVQGVLPQLASMTILLLFPPALRFTLSKRRLLTATATQLAQQRYYFVFLFFHLFLIVSVSAVFTTFFQLLKSPGMTTILLGQNLPRASNYYLSYLLLQALLVGAMTLSQVVSLVGNTLPFTKSSPRRRAEACANDGPDFSFLMPVYTNLACIVLSYAVMAPIILPIGAVSFGIFWLVYRYYFLYVHRHHDGSAGLLYGQALSQTSVGLYVLQISTIGLFILTRSSTLSVAPIVFVGLSMVTTSVFQMQLERFWADRLATVPPKSNWDQRETMQQIWSDVDYHTSIWLPNDPYGISDNELAWLREKYASLEFVNHNASLDKKGRLWVTEQGHF